MNFQEKIRSVLGGALVSCGIESLQVNMGLKCNLSCKHCHVQAGPQRDELMSGETVERVILALGQSDIPTLDITGGAPELNPHFRHLVSEARKLGRHVIVRSNLAVFFEEGMGDIPGFYAENRVEVIASLPYYLRDNVDRVRGAGTFHKCVDALKTLNSLGYGKGELVLALVFNPQGAFLPPAQETLEEEYRKELKTRHGISFDRLYALANMPIGRFRDFLERTGQLEGYTGKLSCAFNPGTLPGLMCRHLINVGWDGTLHDCDFNQVLVLGLEEGLPNNLWEFDYQALTERRIAVGEHCFGCTAGQGST